MAKQEEVTVPIFSSLESVYGEGSQLQEAKTRFHVLTAKFNQLFGATPQLFARSPGTEHVFDSVALSSSDLLDSVDIFLKEMFFFCVFRKSESDRRAC